MITLPTDPKLDNPETCNPLSVATPFSFITGIGGIPIVYPPTELKDSNAIKSSLYLLIYL
jgi:hypothetical protein